MDNSPKRIRIKDIARMADVSVGTVDRVIHGRSGVAEASRKRVEEILQRMNYQPNIYASALASNRKYLLCCILPQHQPGEYWSSIETGLTHATSAYSDFNVMTRLFYYDPYDYATFLTSGAEALQEKPDGIIFAPTAPQITRQFTDLLNEQAIPYIYIDSHIKNTKPLAFYGQNPQQSGYFAARMLMMAGHNPKEIVIFRKINEGIIGSNQQENREKGFRRYMQENHPGCRILELNLDAKKPDEDHMLLKQFIEENPNVRCGITFNSKAYIIGLYMKQQNIQEFNLVGYDLLKPNIECLKEGYITFLIAQQPDVQGYNSVKTCCDHLIFKKEVNCINYMPIDLVARETIDYYLNGKQA